MSRMISAFGPQEQLPNRFVEGDGRPCVADAGTIQVSD